MEADDYRDSHKARGGHYDKTIGTTPFDAYMDRWEAHYLARMIPQMYPAKIPRYLDFACGTGRITERMEPYAQESCGVDISESMLEAARAKCKRTTFTCADLTRKDVDLGKFDLVTSFRFFGNAQDELRKAALRAINRHLKTGGHLVINNHRNPRSIMATARRLATGTEELDLSHEKLAALLKDAGFEQVSVRAIGFWIFRAKLMEERTLNSALARTLEQTLKQGWLARYSPDALVVARKVADAR